MELIGDEKRIRGLFSELRVQDAQTAPRFNVLLNRVARPPRQLNLGPAAGMALLLGAIVTVAWWGAGRLRKSAPVIANATFPSPTMSLKSPVQIAHVPSPTTVRRKTFIANRSQQLRGRLIAHARAEESAANKALMQEAKAISAWTSPTDTLLSSSTAEVLTTLPQLNQNANQLKSFLPSSSN
jgi:hypothetical protein